MKKPFQPANSLLPRPCEFRQFVFLGKPKIFDHDMKDLESRSQGPVALQCGSFIYEHWTSVNSRLASKKSRLLQDDASTQNEPRPSSLTNNMILFRDVWEGKKVSIGGLPSHFLHPTSFLLALVGRAEDETSPGCMTRKPPC